MPHPSMCAKLRWEVTYIWRRLAMEFCTGSSTRPKSHSLNSPVLQIRHPSAAIRNDFIAEKVRLHKEEEVWSLDVRMQRRDV